MSKLPLSLRLPVPLWALKPQKSSLNGLLTSTTAWNHHPKVTAERVSVEASRRVLLSVLRQLAKFLSFGK